MRHPFWFRAFLGMWGLWFTGVLLEAPGIHACPVHSVSGSTGHGHSAHGASSSHSASHGGEHAAAPVNHEPDTASGCTCLGLCCSASPFVVRGPSIESAPIATIATRSTFVSVETPTALARRYARPFANGPPALV